MAMEMEEGGTAFEAFPEETVDPHGGKTVAGFPLGDHLGSGSVGSVYRSVDPVTGATVAVKILDPAFARDEDAVLKFIRGGVAAARIQHPNVVSILKVGRCEETGLHYQVMEYVEGRSLEEILGERGPMPAQEAVPLILQAADGLAAAHGHHVIHRDIKPENLVVGGDGTLKITDIGLARVVAGVSETTNVMGTPHFMPPEQFEGKGMDARTDVYALGVTLYNAVSGKFPYEGEMGAQILFAMLTRPPRPLQEANPEVPGALVPVVERMIAKDPADRFGSMDEVRGALRSLVL